MAQHGQAAFAVDFPGFGWSSGRLSENEATVPALAAWALRFLDAAKSIVCSELRGSAVAQPGRQRPARRGAGADEFGSV
jgi:hypothetical protein